MSSSIEDLLTLSSLYLQLSRKGDRSEVVFLTFTSGAKNLLAIKDIYEKTFLLTQISKAAHSYLTFQGQVRYTNKKGIFVEYVECFILTRMLTRNCVVLHLILFILTLLFACPNCAFLFFLAKVEVAKIVYILPKSPNFDSKKWVHYLRTWDCFVVIKYRDWNQHQNLD